MSYVRAKQFFKDAQRAIKANHDVALLAIVEGLLQLTTPLENHGSPRDSLLNSLRCAGEPNSRQV